MDMFDDLEVDLNEIFGYGDPFYDADGFEKSPTHSSDSGVMIDCNVYSPLTGENINFNAIDNISFDFEISDRTTDKASISSAELDHPYSFRSRNGSVSRSRSNCSPLNTPLNVEQNELKIKQRNKFEEQQTVPSKKTESSKATTIMKENSLPDEHFSYLDDEGNFVAVDKSKKNAVMAKLNRKRKKRYISNLEAEVKSLRTRNDKLATMKSLCDKKVEVLENEVQYLRTVLHNKTMLSSLVKSIATIPDINLSFDESNHNPPVKKTKFIEKLPGKRIESLEDYESTENDFNGGVCLHVSSNNVSIEFCAACNKRSFAFN